MAEFAALPLWTDAYLADTLDLTAEQHGCYLILLMLAWRRPDCSIPNDMTWLKRSLSGCMSDMHGNRFNNLVPDILKRFFNQDVKGYWRQKKLRKVRDSQRKISLKNKENAETRWRNRGKSNGKDMRPHSDRTASLSSSNSTDPPLPPRGGNYRYANGGKKNGHSNGTTPVGILIRDMGKEWRNRLSGFKKYGLWLDSYGPRPGDNGCEAPPEIVAEILGEQHA